MELDLGGQWIAASWAVKTCFVFQTQAPEHLVPPMQPFLLRANGQPPPQVSVFMGSHYRAMHDPINSAYVQFPLSLLPKEDDHLEALDDFGYTAFLAVGGLSFLVLGHRYGNYIEVALGDRGRELFSKIWPRERRVTSWPPELAMDRELVNPIFLDTFPPVFDIRVFPARFLRLYQG